MQEYNFKIIQTAIIVLIFIVVKLITIRFIKKAGKKFSYQSARIKITNKIVSLLLFIVLAVFLMSIWGIDQSKFMLFMSSMLTILGVAFFAQWSIISNITSTLIIFFNHPVKIGDTLTIMEKDYEIHGKLSDIGMFFVTIRVSENEKITLPSNVFMQKMIKKQED